VAGLAANARKTSATPVRMNLPDDAEQDEVRGEIGIGVTGLVLGALLLVAIIVGGPFRGGQPGPFIPPR
jgi:hypothetical protein